MPEIARRVIAVTGGARGIGAAIGQSLAARGARVALGDVDEAAVRATATAIGRGVVGHHLDVTSTASFAAFLDLLVLLGSGGMVLWLMRHPLALT